MTPLTLKQVSVLKAYRKAYANRAKISARELGNAIRIYTKWVPARDRMYITNLVNSL